MEPRPPHGTPGGAGPWPLPRSQGFSQQRHHIHTPQGCALGATVPGRAERRGAEPQNRQAPAHEQSRSVRLTEVLLALQRSVVINSYIGLTFAEADVMSAAHFQLRDNTAARS